MSPRRAISTISASLLIAMAFSPYRALSAQLSIPAGKALEYRLSDSDSDEEISRGKLWRSADSAHPVQWNQATFPDGDRLVSQCVEGNGANRPATMRVAVMLNASGQVDETDFDTFDPSYYPFLHRPLPDQPMESLECFNATGLDFAALGRGEQTSLFVWLNDAIYFRVNFKLVGKERVSVPAGDFDTLKVRARLDTSTFFPNLPGWAAKMIGVFIPDIYVWGVSDERGDFKMVRQTGFPIGKHKHTVQELIGAADIPVIAPADLELLQAARRPPEQPKMTVDNTGTFTVGDLRGRVIMSTGKDGTGQLLLVRTQFSNGLAMEGTSVLAPNASPRTSGMEQRTYAPDGTLVERKHIKFRADSFPLQQGIDLPDDLYAGSQTLGEAVPQLISPNSREVRFHVIGFEGVVNQLAMWQVDGNSSEVAGQDALHMKLKPIIDLPFYLKPLSYFLIPTFDAYLQGAPPYRLLEFTGPFGPPGSPPTHFVADAQIESARTGESFTAPASHSGQ